MKNIFIASLFATLAYFTNLHSVMLRNLYVQRLSATALYSTVRKMENTEQATLLKQSYISKKWSLFSGYYNPLDPSDKLDERELRSHYIIYPCLYSNPEKCGPGLAYITIHPTTLYAQSLPHESETFPLNCLEFDNTQSHYAPKNNDAIQRFITKQSATTSIPDPDIQIHYKDGAFMRPQPQHKNYFTRFFKNRFTQSSIYCNTHFYHRPNVVNKGKLVTYHNKFFIVGYSPEEFIRATYQSFCTNENPMPLKKWDQSLATVVEAEKYGNYIVIT